MNKEFLNLRPTHYLCPYCGEWHDWPSSLTLGDGEHHFFCPNLTYGVEDDYRIYFRHDFCYFATNSICNVATSALDRHICIDSIIESATEPVVTFQVNFVPYNYPGPETCRYCNFENDCICVKSCNGSPNPLITITFGFKFDWLDYQKIIKPSFSHKEELREQEQAIDSKEQALKEREDAVVSKEQSLKERENAVASKERALKEHEDAVVNQTKKDKEDTTMATKTSIKKVLYEKSPKENLEVLKTWAEKYKPVLRWAIPAGAVYGAYRILNSNEFDLSVNNIADTCEKKLGFKVKFLEDKKALKELMVIGGLSAGAYGVVKAISGVFGNAEEEKDISVEEVEAGMNQLENVSKKFAWIQPKTEDLLPIAVSVILVYVTLHKPTFNGKFSNKVRSFLGDFQIKIDTYLNLAKLFIQDKFNIDLSNEEEQRKIRSCAFLVAAIGIFVFLYGRKVLKNKSEDTETKNTEETNKPVKDFVEQGKEIIKKIAPSVYTTLITLLVSKKILNSEDYLDVPEENEDENVVDEVFEDETGNSGKVKAEAESNAEAE